MALSKLEKRAKVKRRIRKKVFGTSACPRLTVYRSNKQIYAQVVDDEKGITIASASSYKKDAKESAAKIDVASIVGKDLAAKAKKAGVGQVVFDRNGYKYHGRVKSLANGAREGGLIF